MCRLPSPTSAVRRAIVVIRPGSLVAPLAELFLSTSGRVLRRAKAPSSGLQPAGTENEELLARENPERRETQSSCPRPPTSFTESRTYRNTRESERLPVNFLNDSVTSQPQVRSRSFEGGAAPVNCERSPSTPVGGIVVKGLFEGGEPPRYVFLYHGVPFEIPAQPVTPSFLGGCSDVDHTGNCPLKAIKL